MGDAPTYWAEKEVDVKDGTVPELAIAVERGGRIRGRLVFDEGVAAPLDQDLLGTALAVHRADAIHFGRSQVARVERDASFVTVGLPPGSYVLSLSTDPLQRAGLRPIEVRVAGRDVTSSSIELGTSDRTEVTVLVSKQAAEISGVVRDRLGTVVGGASVYVFPIDRRQWSTMSIGLSTLRLRWARTDRGGTFTIPGIPPGQYFVLARSGFQPQWGADDVLSEFAKVAVRATVSGQERRILDLIVSGR
jgi:hypothetical protein